MVLLCIIMCLVLGTAMVLKPYFFWYISNFWSTKGGEPTNLYLWSVRISGIVLWGIAIGIVVALLS